MTISFPNQSRAYEASRKVVRFWGYDGVLEKVFLMPVDALIKLQRVLQYDEASLLRAFDAHRELIYAVAAKTYARGAKGPYELSAASF